MLSAATALGRGRHRALLSLLAVALAASACGASKAGASFVKQTSTTSAPPTTTTTQPTAEAVNAWWTSFGQSAIVKLQSDLSPFVEFIQNASTLAQYCPPLASDVNQLLQGPSIPGGQAESDWKAALQSIAAGADDCATGGQQNNAVLMTKGGQELYQGIEKVSSIDQDLQNQGTPLSLEDALCGTNPSGGVLVSVCTPAS